MAAASSVQIAILAGGQSRRMGRDKSFVVFNGKPMIQHVIDSLQPLRLGIMIIANNPSPYTDLGLPLFTDVIPGSGSLGGLYTALERSTSENILCVACDMPFLNAKLLDYLIGLRERHDAVIPVTAGVSHNLHAVYSRRCLPVIRRQIDQGNLRISDIYETLRVRYVEEPELRAIDPELRSLTNLNTPDDVHHVTDRASLWLW